MSTSTKLNKLLETKEQIKLAIEEMGVEIGDIPFSEYPSKIKQIGQIVIPEEYRAFVEHYQAIIDETNECKGWYTSSSDRGDWFTLNAGDSGFDVETTDWEILKYLDFSNVTSTERMFYYCTTLINMPSINTSDKLISTSRMFQSTSNLESVEVFDTSNVTDMSNMFYSTKIIKVPLIDTSSVENMSSFVWLCTDLTTFPTLDFSNVINMKGTFNSCTNLTTIGNLDTSKVTDMTNMCKDCTNLTTIGNLDTSKVTTMNSMFSGCTSLTSIPLLDTSSLPDTSQSTTSMLYNCTSLTSVKINDTRVPSAYTNTFGGVPKTCVFYVPNELLEDFKVATYWSEYANTMVGY